MVILSKNQPHTFQRIRNKSTVNLSIKFIIGTPEHTFIIFIRIYFTLTARKERLSHQSLATYLRRLNHLWQYYFIIMIELGEYLFSLMSTFFIALCLLRWIKKRTTLFSPVEESRKGKWKLHESEIPCIQCVLKLGKW